MVTLARGIDFFSQFCGKTENALRLAKATQQYFGILKINCGSANCFANAEELFKIISSFQNLYRCVKSTKLLVELYKTGQKPYDEGGLQRGSTPQGQFWPARACDTHAVLTWLSPITLAVVSAGGFAEFLGRRGVIPLGKEVKKFLNAFNRYAGAYFGNALAAGGGFLGVWNDFRKASLTSQAAGADNARNAGWSGLFGSTKYVIDFVATSVEGLIPSGILICMKLISSHCAIVQGGIRAWHKSTPPAA